MMKTKGKGKSAIFFIAAILVIFFLAYSGAKGIVIGDYRFKPFSETINRGLDLQGGISVLMESDQTVKKEDLDRTIELLSLRVNKLGVSETSISQEGNKRIRIDIPGKFDTKEFFETLVTKET